MSEQIKKEETAPQTKSDTAITPEAKPDLLQEAQALNEMSNKVTKLEAENKELLAAKKKYYDTIINGQVPNSEAPKERTAKEIREEMAKIKEKDALTNLEYVTKSLELDEAVRRETGASSYLPKGNGITPTTDERDVADRFAKFMTEAVAEANGDNEVFNNIIERHVKKMPIKPKA